MDFTKQTRRAAEIHSRFLVSGEKTCIDCHKGIAHELPDMTGIEPGWRAPPEMRDRQSLLDRERQSLLRFLASTKSVTLTPVYNENLIRVDGAMESPKRAQ
jgi:cytochrome c-type protein NapC